MRLDALVSVTSFALSVILMLYVYVSSTAYIYAGSYDCFKSVEKAADSIIRGQNVDGYAIKIVNINGSYTLKNLGKVP